VNHVNFLRSVTFDSVICDSFVFRYHSHSACDPKMFYSTSIAVCVVKMLIILIVTK
jgi:hypothetical protein